MSKERLGGFLQDVSNWYWDEFVDAEHDNAYTSNESVIFALVRAVAMEKLDAIKIAISRLDGKLKTPVRIETPKIFYIYPNATEKDEAGSTALALMTDGKSEMQSLETGVDLFTPKDDDGEFRNEEDEPEYGDLPSMSLRETLAALGDAPRDTPQHILSNQLQIEEHKRGQATVMPMRSEIPRVKSVMAASLLKMAQDRKLDAMYEVFDQIDGKLVETIEILGEDVYIPMYGSTAPAGAIKNKNGVYMIEAKDATQQWAAKLIAGKRG